MYGFAQLILCLSTLAVVTGAEGMIWPILPNAPSYIFLFSTCRPASYYINSRICAPFLYPDIDVSAPIETTETSSTKGTTATATASHSHTSESSPAPPTPPSQTPSQNQDPKQQTQPNTLQPKPTESSSSPWSRSPLCRRVGKEDFCAFTHSLFNNREGISVITTPAVFLGLASRPPLSLAVHNQPAPASESPPTDEENAGENPYKDVSLPGKGIGLVATSPIRSGRRIMARTPAVMVDDRAFRGLRRDDLALLLAQAILALPEAHQTRFLNLSSSHDSGTTSAGKEHESESQVDLIYKIFTTNAFKTTVKVELPVPGPAEPPSEAESGHPERKERKETMAVDFHSTFTEVSRLNHDCAPNLGYYFDDLTLSHKVYAVKDILPGEELSVSYVDVLHPRDTRQKLLEATWGFRCTCQRCLPNRDKDEEFLVREADDRVEQINSLRRELDSHGATGQPNTQHAAPASYGGPGNGNGNGHSHGDDTGGKVVPTRGTGTPAKALLLITLYELEGAQVRIYEAYYRAALEFNGIGDAANAMRYARLCLEKGLIARGPDRPFIKSMQELVKDPARHWSWRFRLGTPQGGSRAVGEGEEKQ